MITLLTELEKLDVTSLNEFKYSIQHMQLSESEMLAKLSEFRDFMDASTTLDAVIHWKEMDTEKKYNFFDDLERGGSVNVGNSIRFTTEGLGAVVQNFDTKSIRVAIEKLGAKIEKAHEMVGVSN